MPEGLESAQALVRFCPAGRIPPPPAGKPDGRATLGGRREPKTGRGASQSGEFMPSEPARLRLVPGGADPAPEGEAPGSVEHLTDGQLVSLAACDEMSAFEEIGRAH